MKVKDRVSNVFTLLNRTDVLFEDLLAACSKRSTEAYIEMTQKYGKDYCECLMDTVTLILNILAYEDIYGETFGYEPAVNVFVAVLGDKPELINRDIYRMACELYNNTPLDTLHYIIDRSYVLGLKLADELEQEGIESASLCVK